jgi:hypothetical protein
MSKHLLLFPVTIAVVLGIVFSAFRPTPPPAWGFFGHRKINRQAVFTLPPELIVFYKKHIDYVTEHAIDPDKRRYATTHEAPRHYMDLDRYGKAPFENLPRNWTDALMQHTKYFFIDEKRDTLPLLLAPVMEKDSFVSFNPKLFKDSATVVSRQDFRWFFIKNILPQYYEPQWVIEADSLSRLLNFNKINCRKAFAVDEFSSHGIVPYHLDYMLRRLTDAFVEKDVKKILRHSADIGHYIADAHVPLHTTQNYNGQLTGQDGIHAFWESRLPELFADENYDFWVGRAELIEKPQDYFWNIVLESHALVDSVLGIELALRNEFPPDQQMCNEMRGNTLVKIQCEEFAAAYSERLGGMVEARMQASVRAVGSAWYTAWVLAGQPDLRDIGAATTAMQDSVDVELENAVKSGEIKGRAHEQ